MKMLNKSCSALLMSAFLLLGLSLCGSAANAASYVVSNVNASGAGSLRAAVTSANGDGVDSDITFDATVFASLKTVLLGGSEVGLGNNGKLTITGPTAGVEISGNATSRVFSVGAGADVTLSGLTITKGKSDSGAGINNAGTLTVNNCTITLNQSSDFGGGVYNTGTMTANSCTISGNTATSQYGGGILNGNNLGNANAVLTVTGSIFRNNRSTYGAGLSNQYAATTTATNCTFYNNVADERGAGLFNGGSSSLTNCTFVVNSNLSSKTGGGIYGFPGYYVGLTNCLGAQNAPDNFNEYTSDNGGNVQASTVQEAGLNATGLANNGGPTETIALVSRGTAVNAGVNSAVSGFAYDQRGSGYPRIVGGSVDSGAYESSFSPVLVNNTGLTVAPGGSATITEDMLKATDAATNPLTYTITSGTSHGTLKLSGNPTSTFTQADIAAGNVSYTQDGGLAGSDSFVFNAGDGKGGYVSGTFVITIPEIRSLVVTTTADTEENDGLTSLREAINFANEDGVDSAITFSPTVFAAPRKTITLRGEPLPFVVGNGTLNITAPASGVVIDGNNASGDFEFESDATVTLKGLTITGGNAEQGGGIKNGATLLVDSCTLSGNSGSYGGAIYSENNGTGGTLTIRNSTLVGNSAGEGGGLYNSVGSTSIENSTITGNTAPDNYGAGIICPGDMFTPVAITVSNSIISGNIGTDVDYEYRTMNSDNIQSGGYNLIGDGNGLDFFDGGGDIFGNTDPGLAPLAENGGPTPTRALLTGSPAFNAGNPGIVGTGQFDQRGTGFPRVQNGRADIGAFEAAGDSVAPTVVISTPTNNQNLAMSAFTTIAGTATDNVGVTDVSIKLFRTRNGVNSFWNGTSFAAPTVLFSTTLSASGGTSTAWSLPVSAALRSALDAGAYTVVAYGKDNGGNTSSAIGRNFTIFADTTAPVPVILKPTQKQTLTAAAFSAISGTATDNVGVTDVLVKLFRTRNGAMAFWNGTSFGTAQVLIPSTLASPGSTSTAWSFAVSPDLKAALDEGVYTAAVYARDASGNQSAAIGRDFTLNNDTTAPVVTVSSPSQNQTVPVTSFSAFTGNATDAVGVVQVQIELARTRNAVKVFWNGTSFVSTETALPVTLAAPNSVSTTWSYPVSAALKAAFDGGAYELTAFGSDAAGNKSLVVTRPFSVSTDVPSVNITTPTLNQNVPIATFSAISGSATDNVGVTQVVIKLVRIVNGSYLYWNGTEFTATAVSLPATLATPSGKSTTWSYAVTSALKAALISGRYQVFASGRNGVGNFGDATPRPFQIDIDKPVVTVTGPAQNSTLSVSTFNNITGNATDNVGVTQLVIKLVSVRSGVYYYWNGTAFTTTPATLPATLSAPGGASTSWTYVVNSTLKAALIAGKYQVFASGRDGIGNFGDSGALSFSLSTSSALLSLPVSSASS